ncbi:ImmA/IrrE family metallo-endopeptidase [Verrucosispora sp. NA02020]|uniref:ImmA/IrrE family metallo-endopeptidase n=1 Tax=Verrucosispora sp. NA02020 TaxID=2742132 RepID=UPI00159001B1|nr:ImmA/IrrE family metallo-endopeptidase [Verrucosispora sp. NA02020]QKW13842.1 ImmA/IrrE family metallo-endopeptidase [Verrucosispora sp. NA02020]
MWRQRRQIQKLIRQLVVDLPAPLTLPGTISALAAARRRDIQVLAMTMGEQAGPCGLWVATTETDYVLYSRDSSPVLQTQTILHELMHIALRHTGKVVLPPTTPELPDAADVQALLARSSSTFHDRQEHDAELLATYLGAQMATAGQVGGFDDLADETAAVMYRIAATLTD